MVIEPGNFPQFEPSVHTEIADVLLSILRDDVALSDFCATIEHAESQPIRELGVKRTPSLWVYLLDDLEEALPSGMANVITTVSVLLIDNMGRWGNSRQNLYRRVMAHIQRLIHAQVCLYNSDGVQLTDSTLGFNRVEAARIEGLDSFVIELQCVFGSTIVQSTQFPEV